MRGPDWPSVILGAFLVVAGWVLWSILLSAMQQAQGRRDVDLAPVIGIAVIAVAWLWWNRRKR